MKGDLTGSLHRTRWTARVLRAVLSGAAFVCTNVSAKLLPTLVAIKLDGVGLEQQQQVIAAVHLIRVISDAAHAYSDGSWVHPLADAVAPIIALLETAGSAAWCDAQTRELVVASLGFLVQSSGGEAAMNSWLLSDSDLKHAIGLVSKTVIGDQSADYEIDSFMKIFVR